MTKTPAEFLEELKNDSLIEIEKIKNRLSKKIKGKTDFMHRQYLIGRLVETTCFKNKIEQFQAKQKVNNENS